MEAGKIHQNLELMKKEKMDTKMIVGRIYFQKSDIERHFECVAILPSGNAVIVSRMVEYIIPKNLFNQYRTILNVDELRDENSVLKDTLHKVKTNLLDGDSIINVVDYINKILWQKPEFE